MPQTLGIVASHKNNAWWDAWGAAYERALAGVRQAHIMCFGDSVTQGYYGTSPYYVHSWAGRVGSNLARRTGVTAGTGVLPVHEEFDVTDARTSVTGTWTLFTGGFFSKGRYASGGATFTVGPVTCSSFKITYATGPFGGAWTATVDSGTPANYTSYSASQGITTVEIDAGGSGSHTLTITASGVCYLLAVEGIASPTSGVKVSRVGLSGQQVSHILTDADAWSSLKTLRTMSADLAILTFGLNEAYFATANATFEANLSTLIDECYDIGASVLVVAAPPPNYAGVINEANWTSFRTSMSTVAAAKGAGFLDMANYWGSYTQNTAYYYDDLHPNPAGHYDMASVVSDFVVETVAPSTTTFVPTDISNLALWLDASHDASFSYSSGTVVSAWNDRSGNGRNFTTVVGSPDRSVNIKGRKAVKFNGSAALGAGDTLDLGTSSFSIFMVVKRNDTQPHGIISKYKVSAGAGEYLVLYELNQFRQVYFGPSLGVTIGNTNASLASRVVGSIVDRSAGSVTLRTDMATDQTGSFTPDSASNYNTTRSLWLGGMRNSTDTGFFAGYWLNGYIAEIVVYLKALNSTERGQVESYLSSKWGAMP